MKYDDKKGNLFGFIFLMVGVLDLTGLVVNY